jgi:hypothetical protein
MFLGTDLIIAFPKAAAVAGELVCRPPVTGAALYRGLEEEHDEGFVPIDTGPRVRFHNLAIAFTQEWTPHPRVRIFR